MVADVKPTKMVIKVDLQCSKCYRKIKKILCHFPEIRDQVYDEKQNTVTITVVSCNPECIKEKIACKGRDIIVSIEIVVDKPPPVQPPRRPPTPPPPPPPTVIQVEVQGLKQPFCPVPYPLGVCCSCHEGRQCCQEGRQCCHEGRQCCDGRGPRCYDRCGQPAHECQGGNRGCYVSRCDEYAPGCSVM